MILRFLKFNDYRSLLCLAFFSVLLTVPVFLPGLKHVDIFKNSLLSLFHITDTEPLYFKTAGVILLIANILLFDYVLVSQELTERDNHVPAFILSLYLSYAVIENPLNPQLFAQLLLTLSFHKYIRTWRVEKAAPTIFDATFFLSCAIILYPPYWVFFALGIISLGVLRPFSLWEYSLLVLGLGLPYFFYYVLLFLCNLPMEKPLGDIFASFHKPASPVNFNGTLLINFVSILVTLFTAFFFLSKGLSGKVKTQKALTIFLWSLIPCIGAIFITENHFVFTAAMSAMPLSLFTGMFLGTTKSRIFADILLVLLTATVAVSILQHIELIKSIQK